MLFKYVDFNQYPKCTIVAIVILYIIAGSI